MNKFMPLFQTNDLIRLSNNISIPSHATEVVKSWTKKLKKSQLKDEVRNYLDFYDEILVDLLGYDTKDRKYELPTDGSKRVEFGIFDKTRNPVLIFELKGQNAKLNDPGKKKVSPIDQAHQYARELGGIWYVVSNYDDFWIFNYHKPNHVYKMKFSEFINEEGNIVEEKVKIFLFLLSKSQVIQENILSSLDIHDEFHKTKFTNRFYDIYHETRLIIIEEFQNAKPDMDFDEILHFAQIFLNRILFCLFAEAPERNLLPPHCFEEEIIRPLKEHLVRPEENIIWANILRLFQDINSGNRYRNIHAYNGELFEETMGDFKIKDLLEDPSIYESIRIDHKLKLKEDYYQDLFGREVQTALRLYEDKLNPIYMNLLIISSFDFHSEINVDILGKIFELSLKDLEKLSDKGTSASFTARQKDGIYYTPEFITEHIVRTSILNHLKFDYDVTTFDELLIMNQENLSDLKDRMENIKILDPACGSGAFLVKCIDILTEYHEKLFNFEVRIGKYDVQQKKRKKPFKSETTKKSTQISLDVEFDDVTKKREIVLNNIYGVDLNQESVEITKLSIFLKIAKKGVEFPSLNNHIKSGNSIISDPHYANSFDWNDNFSEIMENGGFHIIVGNPPWGADMTSYEDYLSPYEEVMTGSYDIYWLFLYHNIRDLLHANGVLGYIVPNEFCLATDCVALRQFFLKYNIIYMYNLGEHIFEDVNRPSLIFQIKKTHIDINRHPHPVQILVNVSDSQKQKLKNKQLRIDLIKNSQAYHREQKDFYENERSRFDIWSSQEDLNILDGISEYAKEQKNHFKTISKIFDNGRGIDTNKTGEHLVCPNCSFRNVPFGTRGNSARIIQKDCENDECDFTFLRTDIDQYEKENIILEEVYNSEKGEEFKPGYIGEDLQKYHFARPPRTFKYMGNHLEAHPEYSLVRWKNHEQYLKEKILFRKISSSYVATVNIIDDGITLFNDQVYFFQLKPDFDIISSYFYLAIVGSRLFHYIYTKRFTDPDKEVYPYFTQSRIKSMIVPFPLKKAKSNPEQYVISNHFPQYSTIVATMKEILRLIPEYLNTSPDFNFDAYPQISQAKFSTIYDKYANISRSYFNNSITESQKTSTFSFINEGNFLIGYLWINKIKEQIFKIYIENEVIRKFLLYYLANKNMRYKANQAVEKITNSYIPMYAEDFDKDLEKKAILINSYLKNVRTKEDLISQIQTKFNDMDRSIMELFGITDISLQKRITDIANRYNFKIF